MSRNNLHEEDEAADVFRDPVDVDRVHAAVSVELAQVERDRLQPIKYVCACECECVCVCVCACVCVCVCVCVVINTSARDRLQPVKYT